MEKKGSDYFQDILNPYGKKTNYGKIGRRRRLSKLNILFFLHNFVGDHIYKIYIIQNINLLYYLIIKIYEIEINLIIDIII
jgi:hypothetical protein